MFLVPPWVMWMITQTDLAAFSRASEVANIPNLYSPNRVERLPQYLFDLANPRRKSLILTTPSLHLRHQVIRNPTLRLILLVQSMVVLRYRLMTTQMTWISNSHNSNLSNNGAVHFLGIGPLSHVENAIAVKLGITAVPARFVGVQNSNKVAVGNNAYSKGRCVWQMILNFSSLGDDSHLEADMLHHVVSVRIAKQRGIAVLAKYVEVQSSSKGGVVSTAYTERKYVLVMIFRGSHQKLPPVKAIYLTSTTRPTLTTLLHPRVSRQGRVKV